MERSAEQSSDTLGLTQIDSNLDVTAKVTAPTMLIGDENKLCCIEVTNDNKMLITLPTTGKRQPVTGETQTYDMRSIIESIQELNRRTATFNCNVSFTSAMKEFDTVNEDEAQTCFACDLDEDGLPAAQMGEVNLPPKNYVVRINVDHSIDGDYMSVEPRYDSNGAAVYSGDAYTKGFPLTLSLNESGRAELSDGYVEKIKEYFDGWGAFKTGLPIIGGDALVAIETVSHIGLIDCESQTVTFRVLTKYTDVGCWNYTARKFSKYTANEYPQDVMLAVRYNNDEETEFNITTPVSSPALKLRLFQPIILQDGDASYTITSDANVEWASMFARYESIGENTHKLSTVSFANMDSTYVTNMRDLFIYSRSIETITFPSDFDTSNVTNMRGMFSNCVKLKQINGLSSFNTSNVVIMLGMFDADISIAELDIRSFDTSNVLSMHSMFCRRISVNDVTTIQPITIKLSTKFIVDSDCDIRFMFLTGDARTDMEETRTPTSTHIDSLDVTKSLIQRCTASHGIDTQDSYFWYETDRWFMPVCGCEIDINTFNMDAWRDDIVISLTPPHETLNYDLFTTSIEYRLFDNDGNVINKLIPFSYVDTISREGSSTEGLCYAISHDPDYPGLYHIDSRKMIAKQVITTDIDSWYLHIATYDGNQETMIAWIPTNAMNKLHINIINDTDLLYDNSKLSNLTNSATVITMDEPCYLLINSAIDDVMMILVPKNNTDHYYYYTTNGGSRIPYTLSTNIATDLKLNKGYFYTYTGSKWQRYTVTQPMLNNGSLIRNHYFNICGYIPTVGIYRIYRLQVGTNNYTNDIATNTTITDSTSSIPGIFVYPIPNIHACLSVSTNSNRIRGACIVKPNETDYKLQYFESTNNVADGMIGLLSASALKFYTFGYNIEIDETISNTIKMDNPVYTVMVRNYAIMFGSSAFLITAFGDDSTTGALNVRLTELTFDSIDIPMDTTRSVYELHDLYIYRSENHLLAVNKNGHSLKHMIHINQRINCYDFNNSNRLAATDYGIFDISCIIQKMTL